MEYSRAMKVTFRPLRLLAVALCFSSLARPDVIYSNLGPGDMESDGPVIIGSAAAATFGTPGQNRMQLFAPAGTSLATYITLGVASDPQGYGFSPLFDAYLYSNYQSIGVNPVGPGPVLNQPETELAEVQALQAPTSPGLVTFSLPSPISLTAGSLYWVILDPNNPLTSIVWDNFSYEVDGTLLTPEPATLGLLTCALAGLTAVRRKRLTR